MPISTRDLSSLPDIPALELLTQSLAMLDAIYSPEWEYRYFSFNAHWDPATGNRMASLRNGSGDDWFLLFTASGAILKGFSHESEMTPFANRPPSVFPGVLDHVPTEFADFLKEPAFSLEATTFCIWRLLSAPAWQCGRIAFPVDRDPDGSEDLLWAFDNNPETYATFVKDYYEVEPSLPAIAQIYAHQPLTGEMLTRLNPAKDFEEALQDATEIGYML